MKRESLVEQAVGTSGRGNCVHDRRCIGRLSYKQATRAMRKGLRRRVEHRPKGGRLVERLRRRVLVLNMMGQA